ncbi:hypothetical protein POAN111098_01765 [Polynucleobacter antarcticus]
MFRPPPEYIWGLSRKKYEERFRRKVPQWVLTLDRDSSRTLLNICCRLGFKLHPEVLTMTELHEGLGSVWSTKASYRHDLVSKPPKKPNHSTQKP